MDRDKTGDRYRWLRNTCKCVNTINEIKDVINTKSRIVQGG